MFMRHIGGGIGHSFVNPKQDVIGDNDVNIGDAGEDDDRGFGEDVDDHECDTDEDDEDDEGDEDDDDEDDGDEFGPEDGEDVDYGDEDDNFSNF